MPEADPVIAPPGPRGRPAGAESGSYAVNPLTLAARPFSFAGSPGLDITSSGGRLGALRRSGRSGPRWSDTVQRHVDDVADEPVAERRMTV